MRRGEQIAALCFLAVGLYMMRQALVYGLFVPKIGMGPGFMPMLTGAALVLLAGALLVSATRAQPAPLPPGFLPDRAGAFRLATVVGALVAVIAGMDYLGFRVTIFLFVTLLVSALGKQRLVLTLAVALAASVGAYWGFVTQLKVPLPVGTFGF